MASDMWKEYKRRPQTIQEKKKVTKNSCFFLICRDLTQTHCNLMSTRIAEKLEHWLLIFFCQLLSACTSFFFCSIFYKFLMWYMTDHIFLALTKNWTQSHHFLWFAFAYESIQCAQQQMWDRMIKTNAQWLDDMTKSIQTTTKYNTRNLSEFLPHIFFSSLFLMDRVLPTGDNIIKQTKNATQCCDRWHAWYTNYTSKMLTSSHFGQYRNDQSELNMNEWQTRKWDSDKNWMYIANRSHSLANNNNYNRRCIGCLARDKIS